MQKKKLIALIFILCFSLNGCKHKTQVVDKLDIAVGVGLDLDLSKEYSYYNTFEFLVFKPNSIIESKTISSKGNTIFDMKRSKQDKSIKKWVLSTETVYLIGIDRAIYGIKDIIDTFTRDQSRNELAYIAVSLNPTSEVFSREPLYTTNSEDIKGIFENIYTYNFFDTEPTMVKFLRDYYTKGTHVCVPLIGLNKNDIELRGMAIFQDDILIDTVNMKDSNLINLVKLNKSSGLISIDSEGDKNYVDLFCKNKRKIKVSKDEYGNLVYDVYINLTGFTYLNTFEKHGNYVQDKNLLAMELENTIKSRLDFLTEKLQAKGIDWFDLSPYALAKYGQDTDYSNQEHFKNATINYHIKSKISTTGRYNEKSYKKPSNSN